MSPKSDVQADDVWLVTVHRMSSKLVAWPLGHGSLRNHKGYSGSLPGG